MNEVFAFIVGAATTGLMVGVITYSTVNTGWKSDCERIGFHLESSSEQKVYKCELKR